MKTPSILAALSLVTLAFAPVASAASPYELNDQIHQLWNWHEHLRAEARDRGADHHVWGELEDARGSLQHADDKVHHGDYHHVREELDGVRSRLSHVDDELHGEHHHHGFTIQIR